MFFKRFVYVIAMVFSFVDASAESKPGGKIFLRIYLPTTFEKDASFYNSTLYEQNEDKKLQEYLKNGYFFSYLIRYSNEYMAKNTPKSSQTLGESFEVVFNTDNIEEAAIGLEIFKPNGSARRYIWAILVAEECIDEYNLPVSELPNISTFLKDKIKSTKKKLLEAWPELIKNVKQKYEEIGYNAAEIDFDNSVGYIAKILKSKSYLDSPDISQRAFGYLTPFSRVLRKAISAGTSFAEENLNQTLPELVNELVTQAKQILAQNDDEYDTGEPEGKITDDKIIQIPRQIQIPNPMVTLRQNHSSGTSSDQLPSSPC